MDLVVICSLTFSTIFLFVLGIDLLRVSKGDLIISRINKVTGKKAKVQKEEKSPKQRRYMLRQILARAGDFSITRRLGGKIDKKLEEADILLHGGEFIAMIMGIAIGTTLLVFTMTLKSFISVAIGIASAVIPFIVVDSTRNKRLADFNAQISDALTIMSNSLRSGFSFLQSMDMVRKELPNPIKKEFDRTITEVNLGTPIEQALENLSKRVNSDDMELVITAVMIQRQVGGNLAEVLDNIAGAIRERIRIKREIKTLTAQGRISGLIIGLLPVFLAVFMFSTNPGYILELFRNKIGLVMLILAVLGQITGLMIIRKIVDIKF
ncbi:MAG: type II secretion system F family protein [Tepidanaerobacteraceae bacterium]|nr:type II secretion system F family protein [Tepidanaerobacteraceae bacterium]